MFPGSFEWVWDMGHLIFMGIFWLVIAALLSGITIVLVKTAGDLKREAEEETISGSNLYPVPVLETFPNKVDDINI